jgi:hypothetical protein
MIISSDSPSTIDLADYDAILNTDADQGRINQYIQSRNAHPVKPGYAYESGTNADFFIC